MVFYEPTKNPGLALFFIYFLKKEKKKEGKSKSFIFSKSKSTRPGPACSLCFCPTPFSHVPLVHLPARVYRKDVSVFPVCLNQPPALFCSRLDFGWFVYLFILFFVCNVFTCGLLPGT